MNITFLHRYVKENMCKSHLLFVSNNQSLYFYVLEGNLFY